MSGWAAAAQAASEMIGAGIQAHASRRASNAQAEAEFKALQENQRQYDISREDLAPWRESGGDAVTKLREKLGLGDPRQYSAAAASIKKPTLADAQQEHLQRHVAQYGKGYDKSSDMAAKDAAVKSIFDRMMGEYEQKLASMPASSLVPSDDFGSLNKKFTLDDFDNDPVIQKSLQFGLSEGTKALSRMRRGQGTFNSGGTAKALNRFTTDYVGQQAGASRDRFIQDQTNTFNRLSGVAGTGQTAARDTATLGAQTATNAGNIMMSGANARGAASIAQGNAYSNAFSNIGNGIQRQYMMDQVFGSRTPSGGGDGGYGGYVSDDYRWDQQ